MRAIEPKPATTLRAAREGRAPVGLSSQRVRPAKATGARNSKPDGIEEFL